MQVQLSPRLIFHIHHIIPVFMVEVNPSLRLGVVKFEDTHLIPNCLPDFLNHMSFVPCVDVCRGFSGPVSQVLTLVPWEPQLVSTVRNKNSEAAPGEFAQDVRAGDCGPVSVECCFKPPESSVRSTGPWNDARRVLAQGGNGEVQVLELLEVLHLIPSPHQGCPPVSTYEGVCRCQQGHRALLGPEGRDCLRLPGLEFNGASMELVGRRDGALEVIETSTIVTGHLETHHPTDVLVQ